MTGSGTPTRGETMLALRRRRMAETIPFLRGGFRPFFLGGAVWAILALTIWLLSLAGAYEIRSAFDALAWHRHEMLFGFVGAVIAGFLLTAIPNWTGRLPIAGWPLAGLFALWAAGRALNLYSAEFGPMLAGLVDTGFYVVLCLLAAREVLEANNDRNLPVIGIIASFGIAAGLDHLSLVVALVGPLGWQLGITLVILLISLIGGRIIPSFTRNWLVKRGISKGLPTQADKFDMAGIAVTAFALFSWLTGPAGWLSAGFLFIASVLQFGRLARWRGWRTVADPMVLILHVGFSWVPIGLALLALSQLELVVQSAAVHAFTAGAMATMILAVMTRATLGHTGRELRAGLGTSLVYLFVTTGAVLRVLAPLGHVNYRWGMEVGGTLWLGAFVLFCAVYGPILFAPRLGDKA